MDNTSSPPSSSGMRSTLPPYHMSFSETPWDNPYAERSDYPLLWSSVHSGPPRTPTTSIPRYPWEHIQMDAYNPYTFPNGPLQTGIGSPIRGEMEYVIERVIVRKSRAAEPYPQLPMVPPGALSLHALLSHPITLPPAATHTPYPYPQLSLAPSGYHDERDVVEDISLKGPPVSKFKAYTPRVAVASSSPPQPPPFPSTSRTGQQASQDTGTAGPSTFLLDVPIAKKPKSVQPQGKPNIAEAHSAYRPSEYAIYCPWPANVSSPAQRCDKLVPLVWFNNHLKVVHELKEDHTCMLPASIVASRDDSDPVEVCGARLGKTMSRHILGQADASKIWERRHTGPFEGCKVELIGKDGIGRERIELPKLVCMYCWKEYPSEYTGGRQHSLSRHLNKCTKKPADVVVGNLRED